MLDAFLQHIFEPKYHVLQAALIRFPGFCVLPRTAWPQAQKWELVAQIPVTSLVSLTLDLKQGHHGRAPY